MSQSGCLPDPSAIAHYRVVFGDAPSHEVRTILPVKTMIATIALLAWALWFGAIIALFVFVLTLFQNNRDIALQAAPQLFVAYQKYHLVLAAIALLATVAWRIAAPSRIVLVNFALLAIAVCCGVVVAVWIVGPMEALRQQGLSGSAEFKRLHGRSMMLFMAQAIVLLVHGIILPPAISGMKRCAQTAPVTNSQA